MYNSIIVKYGEIGVKGKNRYIFENKLIKNIKNMLKPIDKFNVYKEYGRVYVDLGDYEYDEACEEVKKVFGVVGVCPAVKVLRNNEEDVEAAYNKLKETALMVLEEKIANGAKTFKVESRRGDKSFRLLLLRSKYVNLFKAQIGFISEILLFKRLKIFKFSAYCNPSKDLI